jgi:RNA polymerase subunit RPABC4/transcription elongation factor Spt4
MEIVRCRDCKLVLGDEYPCSDCKDGNGNNEHFEPKTTNENHCMKCGAIIPEGRHICLTCEGTNEMQTFERRKPTEPSSKPTDAQAEDAVNHPAHYQGAHECIDEMLALFGIEAVKGFCMCNVYKYRYRADKKNGAEDIKKADWYMSKLMELEGMTNE